VTGFSADSAHQ